MKKLLSIALIAGFFMYSSVLPYNVATANTIAAGTAPIIGSSTGGSVTTGGNLTNVVVNSGKGGTSVYDWKQFNVGKDQTVNFQFNNHHQTALNKVQAAGGMSHIYGKITDSGIGKETGKIFLLNPNGVFFGDGASVNVNSFTVSSFDSKWDNDKQLLELNRNGNTGAIIVGEGATIHGVNGVSLIGHDIATYRNSAITTDNTPNVEGNTYGKVKIITGDGVNFQFITSTENGIKYSNGGVDKIDNIKTTTAKNLISLEGKIDAGHIDIRNGSTNADSQLVLKGATLKATKAERGEDGSIFLTSYGKIITQDSTLTAVNKNAAAANDTERMGKITLLADGNVSVIGGTMSTADGAANGAGNITINSANGNAIVERATLTASGDVLVSAGAKASVQNKAALSGKNITISGFDTAQLYDATATARTGDVNMTSSSKDVIVDNSTITAANDAKFTAAKIASTNASTINANNVRLAGADRAQFYNSTVIAGGNVDAVSSAGNVIAENSTITASGTATFNATGIASVQNGSKVRAGAVTVAGGTRAQAYGATLTSAGDVLISSNGNAIVHNSNVTSSNGKVDVRAGEIASVQMGSVVKGKEVTIQATNNRAQTYEATVQATAGDVKMSSNGNVIVHKSAITAANDAKFEAGNIASIQYNSNVNAKNIDVKGVNRAQAYEATLKATEGDINMVSSAGNVIAHKSTIDAAGNAKFDAAKIASVQLGTNVTAKDILVKGGDRAQAYEASLTATDGNIAMQSSAGNVIVHKSTLNAAKGNATFAAAAGIASIQNDSVVNAKDISVSGATRAQSYNSQLTASDGNVNIESANGSAIIADGSKVKASGDVFLTAKGKASVQSSSDVRGANITISGEERAQVTDSTLTSCGNIVMKNPGNASAAVGVWAKNSTLTAKNVTMDAYNNVQGEKVTINATENVDIQSRNADVSFFDASTITAGKDATLKAHNKLTYLDSTINATDNINVISGENMTSSSLTGSTLTAGKKIHAESTRENVIFNKFDNLNAGERLSFKAEKNAELGLVQGDFVVDKMDVDAKNTIKLTATNGSVILKDVNLKNAQVLDVKAYNDIKTEQTLDVNGMQANFWANKDIDVKLANATDREKGIIAESISGNITLAGDRALSLAAVVAKQGDVTLKTPVVLAGKPYTSELPVDADGNSRSLIWVGGKFTSEKTNGDEAFDVTGSFNPTADGKFNERHHIQYGANGEEKILLINNRPVPVGPPIPPPPPTPEPDPQLDASGPATMVNKIPLPPEMSSRLAPISDNRANIVDVFAAASQIEIVEDEQF